MILLDVALILFLALAVLNYRAYRSVLYPPFIFCSMWLLDLAVFRSGLIAVDPVHGNTLVIVAVGASSFSLGGLFAGLVPQKMLSIHLFPPSQKNTTEFLRNVLVIVLLCCLPIMVYQILLLSKSVAGGMNILQQARLAFVDETQNGNPNESVIVVGRITMFATYASLLLATGVKDRKFWTVTILAFIMCILSTGRGSLLLLISGLSGMHLMRTKQESIRSAMRFLRWPIALFVALYIGLIFTNKNIEGMSGGATGIATYFVLSYIVGPLAAFDSVVQHPANFTTAANHTFQYFLNTAASLGLVDYTAPPKFDSFVFVPFPTNVYTVFKFHYLELGVMGIITLMIVIGFFHSMLYLKARHGGGVSLFLFSFSIYTVLMVIFDDVYYTIGGYLHAIVFGLLYFIVGSIPFRLLPTIRPGREPVNTCTESEGV